jgi:hypothetical protein
MQFYSGPLMHLLSGVDTFAPACAFGGERGVLSLNWRPLIVRQKH